MVRSLTKIFKEDQADRLAKSVDSDIQNITLRDFKRRQEAQTLINQGTLKNSTDYYQAAMIFQHGDTSEDYKKANDLAKKGLEIGEAKGGLGYESCKWIYAASLDRYLLSIEQKQKYGT